MKSKEQQTKTITPAEPVSKHDELKAAERAAREAFAIVKQTNPVKGASLSSVATTALFKADMDALRGKDTLLGAQHGHEAVHGTIEEKQRRWAQYQAEIDRLREDHPDWSWSNIKRQAAKNMKCSEKTIARHCRDPRQKT